MQEQEKTLGARILTATRTNSDSKAVVANKRRFPQAGMKEKRSVLAVLIPDFLDRR
jgi:hypothetical protein